MPRKRWKQSARRLPTLCLLAAAVVAATAATKTIVSPSWTVTEPSACLASFPVSMVMGVAPTWKVIFSDIEQFKTPIGPEELH